MLFLDQLDQNPDLLEKYNSHFCMMWLSSYSDSFYLMTIPSGYQMLDIRMSKEFSLGKAQQLTISLFGKNLLNEVARNHSSFVKDEVPLAGRNIGLKVNLSL